jgi:hypothetical protein
MNSRKMTNWIFIAYESIGNVRINSIELNCRLEVKKEVETKFLEARKILWMNLRYWNGRKFVMILFEYMWVDVLCKNQLTLNSISFEFGRFLQNDRHLEDHFIGQMTIYLKNFVKRFWNSSSFTTVKYALPLQYRI